MIIHPFHFNYTLNGRNFQRKGNPQVKLHLILPCSNAEQTEKWTAEQKKEFHRILSLADDEAVKICGTAITVVPLFFYDLSSYLCIFIFANFGWEIDVVLSHCIVRR